MSATKSKRSITPEQKAKSDARREKFRELADNLSKMSADERAAFAERVGLTPTIEGKLLSPFNTCLVMTQNPAASMVGGFRQWLAAGRCVRKGESGLMIWIPLGKKNDDGSEPAAMPGDASESSEPSKRKRFIIGTVFDVSQTDLVEAE